MDYSKPLEGSPLAEVWQALPDLGAAIDPFEFVQRMAVYKLLIDCSNRERAFGDDNRFNLFWGYVFQLDWQWQSGRLQLKDTAPGRIATTNPWGYANYSLSIIPLVAAMQAGLTPEKEILLVRGPLQFIGGGGAGAFRIPERFDRPLQEWREFFDMVRQTRPGGDLEPLRFKLWQAHLSSLVSIGPETRQLVKDYSKVEQDFLNGWIRMVDFLGVAAWPTDLEFMRENGSAVLPPRILSDSDIPGHVADMDEKVNRNLGNIVGLARQPQWRFDFNLRLWRRAMRTRAARNEVVKMLDATFNPTPDNAQERKRLLGYILSP